MAGHLRRRTVALQWDISFRDRPSRCANRFVAHGSFLSNSSCQRSAFSGQLLAALRKLVEREAAKRECAQRHGGPEASATATCVALGRELCLRMRAAFNVLPFRHLDDFGEMQCAAV